MLSQKLHNRCSGWRGPLALSSQLSIVIPWQITCSMKTDRDRSTLEGQAAYLASGSDVASSNSTRSIRLPTDSGPCSRTQQQPLPSLVTWQMARQRQRLNAIADPTHRSRVTSRQGRVAKCRSVDPPPRPQSLHDKTPTERPMSQNQQRPQSIWFHARPANSAAEQHLDTRLSPSVDRPRYQPADLVEWPRSRHPTLLTLSKQDCATAQG